MTDERDFDRAEELAEAERTAGVQVARSLVAADGQSICRDCGEEIDAERRAAAPFACRCIQCQRRFEKDHRHA
ncbi:TraR/DksA C4-type zinc finger protein [Rhodobacter capsulatus]|uniref:TraR/DksA C4-type zinc finger protein n=1 Tax=Rhodobacter capsulatus TaxID=1061 RepID=UPI00402874FE